MKKRYSNFHRARKWHRKFRNVLYDPNGVRIWLLDHYEELYYKYFDKAVRKDLAEIDHHSPRGGDTCVLVLRRFTHLRNKADKERSHELSRKVQL